MPHVVVKMYKGRTDAQKQAMCDEITKALVNTVNCSESHITVAVEEYDKSEWGEKVFYPEIEANLDTLLKKPDYKPE